MTRIGIRDLRDALTGHLRKVRKGTRLLITDRGKPVAVLRPVSPDDLDEGDADSALAALEAEGKIRWGRGSFSTRVIRPKKRGTPLSQLVIEDRR
ncbi:MAG: type II toxin-antitoxin system prevent-host-death family antitoxin [Planctomycetes bacterium]|nr:type II toxin-antitoxin system prevent-host-death family antitoxin [Planctomycetota bacterium]